MTSEEHSKQARLCARFGLLFVLVSIVTHAIEHFVEVDLDLGFTFLWVAVLMTILGFLQHLKSIGQPLAPGEDVVTRQAELESFKV